METGQDYNSSTRAIRRSRLERQIEIIKKVAQYGPIRITHIAQKANLNWEDLKKDIQTLRKLGLVMEDTSEKDVLFYTITGYGLETLGHYEHVEKALSGSKEDTSLVASIRGSYKSHRSAK